MCRKKVHAQTRKYLLKVVARMAADGIPAPETFPDIRVACGSVIVDVGMDPTDDSTATLKDRLELDLAESKISVRVGGQWVKARYKDGVAEAKAASAQATCDDRTYVPRSTTFTVRMPPLSKGTRPRLPWPTLNVRSFCCRCVWCFPPQVPSRAGLCFPCHVPAGAWHTVHVQRRVYLCAGVEQRLETMRRPDTAALQPRVCHRIWRASVLPLGNRPGGWDGGGRVL